MGNLERTQNILTGEQSFTRLDNIPSGIWLGEKRRGFFSVVEPVDTTINYVKNPSFRTGDYPYSHLGLYWTMDTANGYYFDNMSFKGPADGDVPECYPMYGGWIQLTGVDSKYARIRYRIVSSDLENNEQYTFSCFVSGSKSHFYSVYVIGMDGDTETEITARKTLRGTGGWQRQWITFETDTATYDTFYLCLEREETTANPTESFWTSMWVCEDNSFVTLPFNGGYEEKNVTYENREYYKWISGQEWSGISQRSDRACNSGRERFLKDYGFVLTEIIGLGSSGIVHNLQPISSGGSVWNSTNLTSKEFVLSGYIQGKTLEERMENEAQLDRLLTSSAKRSIEQPTTLLFRVFNQRDNSIVEGQTLYIYCRYSGGIGNSMPNENGQYEVKLTFTLADPCLYSSMHKGFALDPRIQYQSNAYHMVMRKNSNNEWHKCDRITPDKKIKKIVRGKDGRIFFGGDFLYIDGGVNIALLGYDQDTEDIYILNSFYGAAGADMQVNDIIPLANGKLIIAGWWDHLDYTDNSSYSHNIVICNPISPATDDDSGEVMGATGHPNDRFLFNYIGIDQSGIVYAVGEEVDGGANYVYTYNMNTREWGTLGTLNSGSTISASLLKGQKVLVVNRKIDSEFAVADVYVSGRFESINSVSGTGGIAKYNGETGVWESLGDGIAAVEQANLVTNGDDQVVDDSANSIVINVASGFIKDMVVGKDGKIYMVGNFAGTTGDTASTDPNDVQILSPYVIRYNGYQFEAIGLPGNYSEQTKSADKIDVDNKGRLHVLVSYNFTEGYTTLAKDYFILDGNTWKTGGLYTVPVQNGVTSDGDIYYDELRDEIWLSSRPAGGKITHGGDTRIAENNGEIVFPNITMVGSGQIMSIYNKTTDKIIEFTNYIMQDGEIVRYNLEDYGQSIIKLVSNVNGEISGMIKPSSNAGFGFVKGENKVGYVFNFEGENTSCRIRWREKYLGIYDAINYRKVEAV